MQILIHGNDRGNAMLIVLVLILILSVTFMSFTAHINSLEKLANRTKTELMIDIEQSNTEVRNRYDIH